MEPNPKKLAEIRSEKSLVLIKPDGVTRKIVGELLTRFERKGLKIAGMKMVWPTEELAAEHYTDDPGWLRDTGTKTLESYRAKGVELDKTPEEVALDVRRRLIEHLTAGPAIALVLEGAHVIEIVRKMRGSTSPLNADVGTIGFDYTVESYELSDAGAWAIRNVIHASDSVENAKREIAVWFTPHEIFEYNTALCAVHYTKDWYQQKKSAKS